VLVDEERLFGQESVTEEEPRWCGRARPVRLEGVSLARPLEQERAGQRGAVKTSAAECAQLGSTGAQPVLQVRCGAGFDVPLTGGAS
jgi:hypothetical protein